MDISEYIFETSTGYDEDECTYYRVKGPCLFCGKIVSKPIPFLPSTEEEKISLIKQCFKARQCIVHR